VCPQQGTTWILELNYAYAGFRVVREWSGRKRLFFRRDPREEILIQTVCAENSSWSALRSSSLAAQLNDKNKRRLAQLRATVFYKGQVGNALGAWVLFFNSQLVLAV